MHLFCDGSEEAEYLPVCLPSLSMAIEEMSKQIRSQSVTSAKCNGLISGNLLSLVFIPLNMLEKIADYKHQSGLGIALSFLCYAKLFKQQLLAIRLQFLSCNTHEILYFWVDETLKISFSEGAGVSC